MNFLLTRCAVAFMLLCMPLLLFAGEIRINSGKTELHLTTNTYHLLSFTSHVSSIQFRDIQTKLGDFTELFVPGYGYSSEVGDPKLPVNRKLIEVPMDGTMEVEIINAEFADYSLAGSGINFRIIPQQASVSKAITDPEEIPFVINDESYLKNEFLGGPLVSVTPVGIMRAVNLARLDISPVQYNPVTGTLRIYKSIEAKISFTNGNEQAAIARKQALFSPYFDNIYNQLANYKHLTDELITTAPVTYIIVADPMFEDALQPFIDWKSRKGFKVVEAYTDDPAVGTSTTSISNYLEDFYTDPPAGYEPQSFILFVGDVPQIPAFNGTAGNHPTDLYYCEYTGDKIPECYYGRFSANNLVQLQPQIDKTLEYEQYLFPDELFLGEAVMVAGYDAGGAGLTYGNGQINYGTENYFNTAHGILSHTYLQPEPPGGNYSAQIKQNVSDGVTYANYTAHCGTTGWSNPSFKISDISNLQNENMYCLMVGNCCLSNKFSVNCFGEELLRAENKGALGYIGGTNNTMWNEDFWWAVGFEAISTNPPYNPNHLGAYDVTFHDHGEALEDWFITQGQMFVGGNLAVEQSSTSTSTKTYYWEIYHLMGDPSLMVYMGIPPELTTVYPNELLVGSTSVDITTEPYAYIGLSKDGDTYISSACADSSGDATLTFDALTDPGYVGVVITKQNFKPHIDSIQIIPAVGPYVTLASFMVNDSAGGNNNGNADFSEDILLSLEVSNIGVEPALNVTATLTSTDTNAVITNNNCVIDSIPAGGITICPDAFALTVNDFVEDQHVVFCEVVFEDGNNIWTSPLLLTLNAPVLVVNNITVIDPAPGGNNNGELDPGEIAILRVTTRNEGHAVVGNGLGHLTVQPESSPFIIVNAPNCLIGDFPLNIDIEVDFPVETNGITPIGTIVTLDYNETAGMQNQFSAQKQFEIEIGALAVFTMQNGSENTCGAHFYDSGGEFLPYSNNEFFIMTFFPSTAGAMLKVDFTDFVLEPSANCNYDYLAIYDGNTTLSPQIGKFCGTDSPGLIESTAADGSLTFKFVSDYSEIYPGWEAIISCSGGPLTLIANAFPSSVCLGSSSRLSAIPSGGTGTYTYLWEPATYLDDPTSQFPYCTPDANITYTVTVNDGNETLVSDPVEVTVLPIPDAAIITLNGDLLESSVIDGNQWYYNGAVIPGANQATYQPTLTGEYYVTITDEITGCESDPSNTIYYLFASIDQKSAEKLIQVYPNPFTDRLNITFTLPESSAVRIILTDSFGRLIRVMKDHSSVAAGQHSISLESGNMQPGMYYLRIQTNAYTVIRKVILTR